MQENFNGISEMSGNKVIEKPPENGQNIHRSEPKCVQEETNKISSHETLKNDIKSILESVENSITKKSPVKRLKSANEDVNRENRVGLFSDIPSVFEKSKRITENKLQCNICFKIFSSRYNRRYHFNKAHSKGQLISKCRFGVFKSPQKTRISGLA